MGSDRQQGLKPGTRIGPYVLEGLLGYGGMGAVYRARHADSGVLHALKLVHPELIGFDSDFALGRFKREAEILARIDDHRGMVRVHLYGTERGVPWYSMDHVEGRSLHEHLRRGPIDARASARLVARVADAVRHAHRHGVIHRDLKPHNVLIDEQGEPRVLDFGLAFDAFASRLTRTGETIGTPAYMAPEVVAPSQFARDGGEVVTALTDVYGLGLLLYVCLTGRPPFASEDSQSVMIDVATVAPRAPREIDPRIPEELEAICLRAMEKNPARRYPGAAEMADELERWLAGEEVTTRTRGAVGSFIERATPRSAAGLVATAGLLGAVAVALAAAALWVGREEPTRPVDVVKAIEATLLAGERLDAATRAGLKDLRKEELVAGDPDLGRRVDALVVLADLVERRDEDAAVDRLEPLIHTGGKTDRALLGLVVAALHRRAHVGAIHRLLHERAEPIPAPPGVAADLVRFLLERPGLALPEGAAFDALYEAEGLAEADRGRLLLRRARRHLDRGSAGAEAALADYAAAWSRHAVFDETEPLPEALAERFLAELPRRIERDAPLAWAVCDLVGRVEKTPGDVSRRVLEAAWSGSGDLMLEFFIGDPGEQTEHGLYVLGFLDRYGSTPVSSENFRHALTDRTNIPRWMIDRGRKELLREPGERNPALLLGLARALASLEPGDVHQEVSRVEAAKLLRAVLEDLGPRENDRGLQAVVAATWIRLGEAKRALPLAERAWALEQEAGRPLDRRWPLIPLTLSQALLDGSPEAPDLGRVVELTLLAESVQRAVNRQRRDRRGGQPWALDQRNELAAHIAELVSRLAALGPPDCCTPGGTGPGAPELIDLTASIELRAGWGGPGRAVRLQGVLLGAQGRHQEAHGRGEEALAAYGEALARLGDVSDAALKASYHEARASVLERLGRAADARADRDAAAALRAR